MLYLLYAEMNLGWKVHSWPQKLQLREHSSRWSLPTKMKIFKKPLNHQPHLQYVHWCFHWLVKQFLHLSRNLLVSKLAGQQVTVLMTWMLLCMLLLAKSMCSNTCDYFFLQSKWNSSLMKRVVLFCYMISLSKTEYVGVVVLYYWPPTTPSTHAVRPGDRGAGRN